MRGGEEATVAAADEMLGPVYTFDDVEQSDGSNVGEEPTGQRAGEPNCVIA